MARKLRILSLASLAVFAMSAIAAQAAQAGVFETSTGSSALVTGEQISGTVTGTTIKKHQFTTAAGVVKCEEADFTGTAAASASELTLTPIYNKCTLAGGIEATVNMNSCDYLFTAGTTITAENINVATDVVCPSGHEVKVNVVGSTCEVTIPGQTGLVGLTAATSGTTPTDLTATIDVTGIHYNIHNGASCPNSPPNGFCTNGSYEGVATIKATSGTTGLRVT